MSLQKVTYIDLVTIIGAQNLNDIQDAIIALEEWQSEAGADIPQILANIAPSFSNSTSYSAGDCVIVLNKLYQFTAAHPAGNWTGTDATEVNVTSLLKEAVASLSGEVDDLKSALMNVDDKKAPVITKTANGNPAIFYDGADNLPVKELAATVTPVQSGSGTPSRVNVRPITGFNNCVILCENSDFSETILIEPTQEGTGDPSRTNIRQILPGLSFTLDNNTQLDVYKGSLNFGTGKLTVTHGSVDLGDLYWRANNTNESGKYRFFAQVVGIENNSSTTVPPDCICSAYTAVSLNSTYSRTETGISINIANEDIIIYDSGLETATEGAFTTAMNGIVAVYPLANPVEYNLSNSELSRAAKALGLGFNKYEVNISSESGTVYKGHIDVTNGKLYVSHKMVDFGDLTWSVMTTNNAQKNRFRAYVEGIKNNASATSIPDAICSEFEILTPNSTYACTEGATINISGNEIIVYSEDNATDTPESFQVNMDGVQMLCPLTDELVYTIPSAIVRTLFGKNIILSNTGAVDIQYSADTTIVINNIDTKICNADDFNEKTITEYLTVGLPTLYLYGDITGMTGDDEVSLKYVYKGNQGTCTMKWQGHTSLSFEKKNYTIKFSSAINAGWGNQKKYCLKANYIDSTSALNVCGAKLWAQIVDNRGTSPAIAVAANCGAMDGYPCIIMLNDEFHGLYTFNTPKDKWTFGMGTSISEYIVNSEQHCPATQFKSLALLDDTDYELEYADDSVSFDTVKAALNDMLGTIKDLDSSGWETTANDYLDVGTAIDYMIFSALIANTDGVDHNFILTTYNGVKWWFNAYDLDSILGNNWTGGSYYAPNHAATTLAGLANTSHLFYLIKTYSQTDLKNRYSVLRNGILSEENVYMTFYNFCVNIPEPIYHQDNLKWPTKPGTITSTLSRIMEWYRYRCKIIDAEIEAM